MQSTDCPFCAHANPAGAKFCNECGSPLHLAPCSHCEAVNHVNDVQCYRCGEPRGTRTVVAREDTDDQVEPVGLEQQARWVEQELRRFAGGPHPTDAPATGPEDMEQEAIEPRPDAVEHDLGTADVPLVDDTPEWHDPVRAGVHSPGSASTFATNDRNAPASWASGGWSLPEARRLFSEVVDRPRSRWPEFLGAVSAVLVVLTLIAGGYWYYDKKLASRVVQNDVIQPAPVYSDRRPDEASAPPRPERTSLTPQAKAVEFDASRAPLPVKSPLAAPGPETPAEAASGRDGSTVASRPAPPLEAAPAQACPAAVDALSLCDWIARADRN
jgi:hypothetical protein